MPSIAEQLAKLNIGTSKIQNGSNWKQILKSESERLKQYIQDAIDETVYMSYYPKVYKRSYQFERSLYVDDFVDIDITGSTMTMYIKFNDVLAYHNSLWNGSDGYLPILLDQGWSWHNSNVNIYRLSNFGGYHFLDQAIQNYNRDNPYGIIVKIEKY